MLRSLFFVRNSLVLGLSALLHAAILLAPAAPVVPSRPAPDEGMAVEIFTESGKPAEGAESAHLQVNQVLTPAHDGRRVNFVRATADSTSNRPIRVGMFAPTTTNPGIVPRAGEPGVDGVPRFAMAVGAIDDTHGIALAPVTVAVQGENAPLPETMVDSKARLVRGQAPVYPFSARADGVEGDVDLELVVGSAGEVENARVMHGLGHGLDELATNAARRFQFSPAMKRGRPVRVLMGWSLQFRLQ